MVQDTKVRQNEEKNFEELGLELRRVKMATQTSLAMAGARVAGIPPVNVPGLINPPVRKKGFIGAISSSGQFTFTFFWC